ncbi:MAG: hypothetical protein A2Z17_07170 [Gammaproteobacteria bacterium RBG_16_66_13]|nr:MAG: hypothetical protein A2Z17_07170 [Gammaproteobacteria bacterium RBG_16_66_13]
MPRLIGPDELRQAIAALRLDVPVYYGQQANDGQITLYLYGGPVVVWIPTGLRPAMSTDMDVAAPTTRDAAGPKPPELHETNRLHSGGQPAASGLRARKARARPSDPSHSPDPLSKESP